MVKKANNTPASRLLEQVRFIRLAQRAKGDEMATHCIARYGMIVAHDRTLAAGAPIIEDDLECCPQTERLLLALDRCGAEYQLVQQAESLYVRSGEFSAYVPLCDPAKLPVPVPDPAIAPLGDAFRAALMVAGSLAKESAATLLQSCVQIDAGTCIATNGYVILQTWHGFDMPPGLLVPKAFVDALVKTRRKIVAFGFSKETFTVHFEDRSWLRTNLYQEKILNVAAKLVDDCAERYAIPKLFFAEVAEASRWSEDGRVYVYNDMISSHHPEKKNQGTYQSLPMPELKQGLSYSIAALKLMSKHVTHYNDSAGKDLTMFYGLNLRGAVAHDPIVKEAAPQPMPSAKDPCTSDATCFECGGNWNFETHTCSQCDNDIPF